MLSFLLDAVLWAHLTAARLPWFSWLLHAVLFLPGVAVLAWRADLAGFVVFGYRELEQIMFRLLNEEPLDPVDHVMDVLAPGLVGVWLL